MIPLPEKMARIFAREVRAYYNQVEQFPNRDLSDEFKTEILSGLEHFRDRLTRAVWVPNQPY